MRDLRAELKDFMEANAVTMVKCAKAIGIAHSALSAWLRNVYRSNPVNIDNAVRVFLDRQKYISMRPGRPRFVTTTIAKKVFEVARICHLDREIGVCYGRAGLGKTIALKEYASQNPDVILIEADIGHTTKALISEIHKRLDMSGFGTVYNMFLDIVDSLECTGGLVIVDEAENLPYKALEMVRRLHDKAGVGILLVGMPRLIANLRGRRGEYAQLYSRVGIAARLDDLMPADTQIIIESVIPTATGLSEIFHNAALGNTRTLSKLIARSERVCEINKTSLSNQLIIETAKMLII